MARKLDARSVWVTVASLLLVGSILPGMAAGQPVDAGVGGGGTAEAQCGVNEASAYAVSGTSEVDAEATVEPVTLAERDRETDDEAKAAAGGIGYGEASATAGEAEASCGLGDPGVLDDIEKLIEEQPTPEVQPLPSANQAGWTIGCSTTPSDEGPEATAWMTPAGTAEPIPLHPSLDDQVVHVAAGLLTVSTSASPTSCDVEVAGFLQG